MSMSTKKKLASVAAAGAAAAAIGLGVSGAAQADTATPTPSPTTTSSNGSGSSGGSTTAPAPGDRAGGGRHGGPGGMGGLGRGVDTAELATALGVDEAKLKTALGEVAQDLKANGTAPAPGTKPDPAARDAELATKLAGKLGIDASKVTAALATVRAAEEAEHEKAFDDRLAKAVTDKTLTQAEADAVKKAAEAGVIPMGGGRH